MRGATQRAGSVGGPASERVFFMSDETNATSRKSRKSVWISSGIAATAALGIVGVVVGVGDKQNPSRSSADSLIQQLAELVDSGTRRVFSADMPDGPRVKLHTYYESEPRDRVFQSAVATQLGLPADTHTIWVLTIANVRPPTDSPPPETAGNGNGDAGVRDDNGNGGDELPPLRVGDERVTVTLSDGRVVVSQPLAQIAQRESPQVEALLHTFASDGEILFGHAVRRYIAFPASLTTEQVTSAKVRLADGRLIELTPRTETYAIPPGLKKPATAPPTR